MRRIRQTLAALAAPALLLGLTACGGAPETPQEPTLQTEEKLKEPSDGGDEQATDTQEGTTEESASPPEGAGTPPASTDESAGTDESVDPEESQQPTTSEEPTEEESSDGGSGGDTVIAGLWVGDSWEITDRQDDPCEFSFFATPYTESDNVFACGATADSLIACALEKDETVVCISDPLGQRAQRFQSPTAAAQNGKAPEPEQPTIPLIAELPDGAVCTAAAHDHGQHYDGLFSWYYCDDGSELLTPDEIGATFDRGAPWTVQRSVDGGAPETTPVTTATFADPEA